MKLIYKIAIITFMIEHTVEACMGLCDHANSDVIQADQCEKDVSCVLSVGGTPLVFTDFYETTGSCCTQYRDCKLIRLSAQNPTGITLTTDTATG